MKLPSTDSPVRTVLRSFDFMDRAGPCLIGIDPGLQGTGLALFRAGSLIRAIVLQTPSTLASEPWWVRAEGLSDRVADFVSYAGRVSSEPVRAVVVMEMPRHFGTASSSMGFKTGDLVKLAYLVGMFHGVLRDVPTEAVIPVTPTEWKGQLPKSVVIRRCRKRLGWTGTDPLVVKSHAWDAVGIGLWAQGRL